MSHLPESMLSTCVMRHVPREKQVLLDHLHEDRADDWPGSPEGSSLIISTLTWVCIRIQRLPRKDTLGWNIGHNPLIEKFSLKIYTLEEASCFDAVVKNWQVTRRCSS